MSNVEIEHESILGYRSALEEMQNKLSFQKAGLEASKTTARQILTSASLVIGLMGVLQIIPNTNKPSIEYWVMLSVAGVLYLVLIGLCAWVISMSRFYTPIKADWEEIYKHLIVLEEERDLLRDRLSSYLNVINMNRKPLLKRAIVTNCSVVLLGIIIILLLAIGVIGKV